MARIVDARSQASTPAALDGATRRKASRLLERAAARNPLRRYRPGCGHPAVRDVSAQVGDLVWCGLCADWTEVAEVVQ